MFCLFICKQRDAVHGLPKCGLYFLSGSGSSSSSDGRKGVTWDSTVVGDRELSRFDFVQPQGRKILRGSCCPLQEILPPPNCWNQQIDSWRNLSRTLQYRGCKWCILRTIIPRHGRKVMVEVLSKSKGWILHVLDQDWIWFPLFVLALRFNDAEDSVTGIAA